MNTATFIKKCSDFRGDARLYRFDPPLPNEEYDYDSDGYKTVNHEWVIVSATSVLGAPETYLFPSNESGKILDWGEMNGSQKGTLSHDQVICDLGYDPT